MPFKDPNRYREYMRERRDRIRSLILEAKDTPCADCARRFPFYVMQFDHVRGQKSFTIGHGIRVMKSAKAVQAEIAKCDVVCANCHAIRTHERGYFNPRIQKSDQAETGLGKW